MATGISIRPGSEVHNVQPKRIIWKVGRRVIGSLAPPQPIALGGEVQRPDNTIRLPADLKQAAKIGEKSQVSSGASVPAPEPLPAQRPSAANHSTIDVARAGRDTPGSRAVTASGAVRTASQGRASDEDMPMPADAGARAQQVHQRIPRCLGAGVGAGMAWRTGSIQFSGRNAG
jgi:hypothetical protein